MKKKSKYKIGILSLGCPRNLVDSESVLGQIRLKGYPITDIDKADIAVVNTCAFIKEAKEESVEAILDLIERKQRGKLKKIIVFGCLVQRYKDELIRELPEIDVFVGRVALNGGLSNFALTPRHYRYLKVCEGCINNCSYCIIPKIKGKFASLDLKTVLDKVDKFDKSAISELNIIGQDITGYGWDLYGRVKLAELLSKIAQRIHNIGWVRLLYLYPSRVNRELIEVIRDEPRICKYIDLPIQHINNRILRLMWRSMRKEDILRLIDTIRKKIPQVALRTSIIVGFPSETDKEFQELLSLLEEVKFERLGAFMYSREEGTPAFDFKGQIPKEIKQERLDAVMAKQQRVSLEVNKRFMGKVMDVLVEAKENNAYLGRTQYDAPEVDGLVYLSSKKALKAGDFVKARVTDTLEYDLVAEAVS